MAIGKAFGRGEVGKGPAPDGVDEPGLPAPANDVAVAKALEDAVSAAVEAPAAPAAKKVDPLLSALQYLARRWGRPVSRDVLVAGLPLKAGMLTMPLLERALERIGLIHKTKRVALRDLAEFDMPALIVGKTGEMLVIIGRTGRHSLAVFDPLAGKEAEIQTNTADWRFRHQVMVIKPSSTREGETWEGADNGAIKQKHWLRAAMAGHWKSVWVVLLAASFINVFAIAMPLFSMNVYDRVLPNKALSTLWVLAIGLLTVFAFDFLLKIARGAIIDHAGRQIDFRLSSVLFDKVMNASVSARPASTGVFINRISQYEVLRDFFTSHTVVMFIDVLFMGVFVWVIAMLIGWVVIFPVAAAAIAIAGTIIIAKRSAGVVKAALQESSMRNAILVESLSATQTVKAARA
jgi:ATP-binding cassette subfamily C protein LapB